jgi:hypothetical protein
MCNDFTDRHSTLHAGKDVLQLFASPEVWHRETTTTNAIRRLRNGSGIGSTSSEELALDSTVEFR